jgi:hypothetical protein
MLARFKLAILCRKSRIVIAWAKVFHGKGLRPDRFQKPVRSGVLAAVGFIVVFSSRYVRCSSK